MITNLALNEQDKQPISEYTEEIIRLTNLDNKIDRLIYSITQKLENDRDSMPAVVFDRYKNIILSVMHPSTIKANLREHMLEHIDTQKGNRMLNFLKDPLVSALELLEESAKTLEANQAMQAFFSNFSSTQPTKHRKHLIEQLDTVKGSSTIVISTQVELLKSITWGMRNLSEEGQQLTFVQLEKFASNMKGQVTKPIQQQVWMRMLFAFKTISDQEMNDALLLYASDDGEYTVKFIQKAYMSAYTQSVDQLQSLLEKSLTYDLTII